VNITKGEDSNGILWRRLLDNKKLVPLWWEMKESIGKDMDDYIQLLEDEDEENLKVCYLNQIK